jgi:predicted lipoprotein with Yx(FWY)xxD motif
MLMLTACGGGHSTAKANPSNAAATSSAPSADPSYATDSPAPSTDSPAPAPSPTRTWKGTLALAAVQNPNVGKVVVDGKGFTLYRFDKDTAKPPVSNCFKACAKLWPPVKFTKHMKLAGIDPALIGNIMTKDGICQATLGGWPIYRYAKDAAAGDTNGQGVGGTWFAVAPNGKKAAGGSAPAPAPPAPGGYNNSGY